MSSPASNATKSTNYPNVHLSARLYALLRSEKPQGAPTVNVNSTPGHSLGGYSGLPSLFGFGQQTHPLVAAAAQAALTSGGSSTGGLEFQVQKFEDLQSALGQLRRYADQLPGGQYSPEEQIRHMDVLREQIRVKSELLNKFKQSGAAGILEQTPPSVSTTTTTNSE